MSRFAPVAPLLFTASLLAPALAGCPETPVMTDAGSSPVDAGDPPGTDAFRAPDAAEPVDAPVAPDAAGPRCEGADCAIVEIALGFESTCARRGNGEILCWGRGQSGELGDGASRHLPGCTRVGSAERVDCADAAVSVDLDMPATHLYGQGGFGFCAEVAGGDFYCWGGRGYLVTGAAMGDRLRPELTPIFRGARSFADAWTTTCWLDATGTPSCIGSNGVGQLAQGDFMQRLDPVQPLIDTGGTPEPLAGLVEIATSTVFGGSVCARSADQLYCWGSNDVGQLGDPAMHSTCVSGISEFDCSEYVLPVAFAQTADIERLSLGSEHTCALLNTGRAWCWGGNRAGELGLGTAGTQDITQRAVPTELTAVDNIAEIELGARHTCARLDDGTVWCWGSNDLGQLGDGLEEHADEAQCMIGTSLLDCSSVPVRVAGIDDAIALDVGRHHSCVIREGGTVWCWGFNEYYGVTPGSRLPVFTPTQVTSL